MMSFAHRTALAGGEVPIVRTSRRAHASGVVLLPEGVHRARQGGGARQMASPAWRRSHIAPRLLWWSGAYPDSPRGHTGSPRSLGAGGRDAREAKRQTKAMHEDANGRR